MAIAVPLLMMAAGASTAAIAATTLVLAVTGISAKINKAAANVFGEDLVKAANIVGGVYLAYTSLTAGAGGEAAAGDAATTGAEGADAAANAADATTSVTDASTALPPDVSVGTTGAGGSTAGADAVIDTTTEAATSTAAPTVTANGTAGADYAGHTPVGQAAGAKDQVNYFNMRTDPKVAALSNSTNKQVASWWDGLSAQEKAATMQVGGTMLSGALSGYAQGQKADQEMELAKMRLQNQSTTVGRVAPARVTTATPGALRVR